MKFKTLFLLTALTYCTVCAQNGTGIMVTGQTSVCPNAIYSYQMQIVGTNICYIEVNSTGGHRVVCNTPHDFSGSHPTSDFGYFQSLTAYPQGTIFNICIHWVSNTAKSLCFTAYNCSGSPVSNFCITINQNSPSLVVQGTKTVCNGQYAYFTGTSGLSNYQWSVVPDVSETYSYSGGGAVVNIGNLQTSSWHMVSVSAMDCWGNTKYASKSFNTLSCAGHSGSEAESGSGDDGDVTEGDIIVYPNPIDKGESLTIDAENAVPVIKEYRLYGLDGRLLQTSAMTEASTTLVMPVQAGMYILVLVDETNQLHRCKITVL